jgi:hypothetical protein
LKIKYKNKNAMPLPPNIEYKSSWHDDYLKWICGFEVGTRRADFVVEILEVQVCNSKKHLKFVVKQHCNKFVLICD